MRYYVIRHIPTAMLLPARVKATYCDFDFAGAHEPRLFATERAAKNCATCWAQAVPTLVEGRKREDLEVVPVDLSFVA